MSQGLGESLLWLSDTSLRSAVSDKPSQKMMAVLLLSLCRTSVSWHSSPVCGNEPFSVPRRRADLPPAVRAL